MIEVLTLRIAEVTYGLPLSRIAEVSLRIHVHAVPEIAQPIAGFVVHRGAPVPLVDMRRRLGYPDRPPRLSDHFVFAYTSRRRERRAVCLTEDKPVGALIALGVDRAVGLAEIDQKTVQASPRSARHVAGVVPTRSGLLLIADIDAALSLEEERAVAAWLRDGSIDS